MGTENSSMKMMITVSKEGFDELKAELIEVYAANERVGKRLHKAEAEVAFLKGVIKTMDRLIGYLTSEVN